MSGPWTVPGLSVEERARETVENYPYDDERKAAVVVAAALRAAIEDAALVAEGMAFDAIAARIRALKEDRRG